ncbi:MAG: hypothetical protein DHS20C18_54840 [Saprospiraceae bacterium]|nr:MAG: hypothetical protein DHS20C18_54840 [Saprospiraceae bacterium]
MLFACSNTENEKASSPNFTVKNPLDAARKDVLLVLNAKELAAKHPSLDWSAIKFTAGENIPFQANDLDGDKQIDEFALMFDLAANEEKIITITPLIEGEKAPVFKKRTQAEISHKINGAWKGREYEGGEFKNVDYLRVPPEHTDHSWFIRYEGPGWESDLVGYRFYLDWRNATDIFGKKTTDMVLQDVGQDGFDSYHEPSDWGMDVLKVGESLGIGALGTWMGDKALRVETTDSLSCQIVLNGDVESMIRTIYSGWKAGDITSDVTSDLSIQAGSRLTRHDVKLSQSLPNLCTGIVKDENGDFFKNESGNWGYIGTWGKQSLAQDHLGMAVLFKKSDLIKITEDEFSHVVVLEPKNNELTYYFLGAWEQELGGIKTQEAFMKYLEEVVVELSMPLDVKL